MTEGTRRLALGGPKQRALLALLLLHREAASRDWLVEALWQGRPPKAADGTLRAYLSRLRRELGPERLRLEAAGYLLVVDADEVDGRRFEQLALAGRRALAEGDPRAAADLLAKALELWRGDVVVDVAAELPPLSEPARLEELRLAALEDRIDADLALGRHRELVGELESLVVAWPFRERLRSQLMLSLYRSERQADALAAYGQARTHFREELGLEPGPRLRDLQGAILRHEVPTVSGPTKRSHNLPTQLSSFIGRQPELVELEGLVRQNRLVALTGVGGVGKTRLAFETAMRLLGTFRDGIRLVELAPVGDASGLSRAVGDAIGLDASTVSSPDLDVLCARLEHSETLLILDNCEHLAAPTAELVEKVLGRCDRVSVLVTSRQRLGIPGEVVCNVQPFGKSA
ncbi:MAG TPA: BTAD domain-containing putative transcriptional regulator, partial [Gaiellaceae bacterium]|nr:BTAD domain-containing putative transcriptional regulator [Gaiellaceae bacterium]